MSYSVNSDTIYKILLYNYNSRNYGNFTLHIDFTPAANQPPVASATVSPTIGPEGTNFAFDGSGSTDDRDDPNDLTYVWTEGGEILDNNISFSKSNFSLGTHTIRLTVTDTEGLSDYAEVTIIVSNEPLTDIVATDNSYKVSPGNTVSGNMMTDDTGSGVDQGSGITVTSVTEVTTPSKGSIVWNSDGSFTYTPTNGKVGVDTLTYTITDTAGQTASATLSFNILDFSQSNPRDFTKVWINGKEDTNIYGDLTVIGNQSLCWKSNSNTCQNPPFTASNNSYSQENINEDPNAANAGYANSTSADLTLGPNDEVVDAWLYWIGRIYTINNTERAKRNNADRIYLKTPTTNGNYIELHSQADKFAWMVGSDSVFDYGGAINIKQYVLQSGTYWVADLQATEMSNQGSGWAIAVIIKDKTNGNVRSIKNISLFDGFTGVYSHDNNYPDEITQHIAGFKTPREGDVDANLIFFGGESDRALDDRMSLTDKSGTEHFLEDSLNDTHNVQNGTISRNGQNVTDRNPNFANTLGVDIDEIDVSTVIQNNQTQTDITLYSEDDRIFLSMFGFATELYQPNVCYDYVLKRNEFLLPSDNAAYNIPFVQKDDQISFTVAIWDISGDIDPKKVTVGLGLMQTAGNLSAMFNPDKAYYTLPNGNTLLPTNYADPMSTPSQPFIAIGKGRSADGNTGGTISPNERYYTKFYFKANTSDSAIGNFNVDVNVTLNYGSGDFWQFLAVDRCPQSAVYSPNWYRFNIEKVFSSVPSDPTEHYSLPTRIAGKDFDYSVASYIKDSNGEYTDANASNGITVDVEMINIDAFDDNSSYFKCGNAEPSIIVMPGRFVHFNGEERINITDPNDLVNTYAIRSATFRMWFLIDENGTIIPNTNHRKDENYYFDGIYTTTFQAQDPTGLCSNACTPPYSYTSPRYPDYDQQAQGCYACLRDFFAQPICARDNFAIRPKAIEVRLSDRGQDANLTASFITQNNDAATFTNIAAEYPYELNLTAVRNANDLAEGYYSYIFKEEDDIQPSPTKTGVNAASAALHKFEDSVTCADDRNKTIEVNFENGNAISQLDHDNAGKYSFEIWDINWTKVDNASINPYKTIFDPSCENSSDQRCSDCILGATADDMTGNEKTGCLFGSELTSLDGTLNNNFTKLNVFYKPYQFDLNSITLHTRPHDGINWLYMNDLIQDTTMVATLEGNITAEGKNGTALSNFANGCAAEDVVLWLDRTMQPVQESDINDSNLTPVRFQQGLQDVNGWTLQDNSGGYDMNASLVAANFVNTSDLNGSADVNLSYNFKKPYAAVVNPIDVNFSMLSGASPDAKSYANQVGNYIPDGNVSINAEHWFYFAKVKEADGTDGKQEYGTLVNTTIHVMSYCDTAVVPCSILPGFATIPDEIQGTEGWYRMKDHLSSNGDGQISSLATAQAGVSISPNSNITFDTNGTTGTITITYPLSSTRPVHPVFQITPDEWLKYDSNPANNGIPEFIIHFLTQGLKWKGKGETGHVMETEPSTQSSGRLNW
ncbi:hypothetical protein YH65_02520 [Sulfurovum lithotrophicum]|uniref:PKD/Chitinase domain-containing protein n=1 Tax=Sulfurovum lithotrophicum TaxID=206403 RepID=A0A7U4M033_9BACT|nr:Ig-like domain-containing protein [Sulfurovum lithotrophicum]AKF24393.1 hypothetical protein YH65_02520 [Sulfurovum lithotrophicum]